MILGVRREEGREGGGGNPLNAALLPMVPWTKNVISRADLWPSQLPRKVMDVSYFAESKGVVGCH
jgi:hypothetical protein